MASRDLTPLMRKFRQLINRREGELKNYLRFEPKLSSRSIPAPEMPHGVSGELASNYFYTRDARRTVQKPSEPFIYGIDGTKSPKQLEDGEKESASPAAKSTSVPQPGQKYAW